MTRRFLLAALLGVVPALAADLPTVDQIIDHYVEATGGKAAYEKIHSEHVTGTLDFAAMGIKGKIERWAAEPSQYYATLDIAGIGKTEMGYTDGVAWEKSAVLGVRVKSGDELAQAMREATMHATMNWKRLYEKGETVGVESIDGEDCYKVLLTPREGKPETMYFQKKSGLAVKSTTVAASQMGDVPVEVIVSNYKDFGGIKVPAKTVQKAAGQEFSITIENVEYDAKAPASAFALPADVKALADKAKK